MGALKNNDEKKESVFITGPEAEQQGVPMKTPSPPPDICEFCGNEIYRQGIIFNGAVMFWKPFPERCECDQAQKKWEEYDVAEEKRKADEELAKVRQAKQAKIDRLIGKSGIKRRFQQRTFENFIADTPQRKKSYNLAKEYADTFPLHYANGDGLYIEGTNGTGKTHLAAAIALQLIAKQGIPVICKTSSDLLLDIKKAFDNKDITESAVLNIYKTVDLLVIDDLGKEQCSDWSMSTLYSILNDRYEDLKPTIITTNYNSDDLLRALTPKGYDNTKIIAILSRLREVSTVITMAWEDYRTRE